MNIDKPHKYKYHDFGDTRKTKDCWCGLHKEDPLHIKSTVKQIKKIKMTELLSYVYNTGYVASQDGKQIVFKLNEVISAINKINNK